MATTLISPMPPLAGWPLSLLWWRPHRATGDASGGCRDLPSAARMRLFSRRVPDDGPSHAARGMRASGGDDGELARRASIEDASAQPPAITVPSFPHCIETERLTLEPPKAEDYPYVRGMAKEPSMFAHSGRNKMSPEEAWDLLLRHVGHWQVAGYGAFAARERASGRFVGLVGGSSFHRCLGSEFDEHPELTWSIVEEFRGKGYATEAAAAVIEAFDAQPDVGATVCLIHVENQASMRVAAKLGFRVFRRCDYRGYPARLLSRRSGAAKSIIP